MLEHRSLDPKGTALALLLAAAIAGEALSLELVLSTLLVVVGIALTMAR